ncbi:neutral/alkaline non-lysosomal ceramidase N-terminal domain-containing protein [Candidatus Omnitrophota bacterium]
MTDNNANDLLAGFGRTDITPPPDCLIDGFAARDHCAEGIHDNLRATALALSHNGKIVVIAGLDLLELTDRQVDTIREKMKHHYNIEPHQLLLNCSHTHAGPMVQTRFNRNFCEEGRDAIPDESYIAHMIDNIVQAAGNAIDTLKPANISWGIGETSIGVNRRAPDVSLYKKAASGYQGFYANYPNPDKKIDRTCPVFHVKEQSGKPMGIVYGAPCHPTTMSHDNYLVSAEYPGAAGRIIEDAFDGAPALFLQGIGGDVKPRQVALDTKFRSGTYEDVEAVGKELASDVLRIIEAGLQPLDNIQLRTSSKRIPLPIAPGAVKNTFLSYDQENQQKHHRVWAKRWLDRIGRGEQIPESRPLALSLMELSKELRFAGIAGELLTDIGLLIKGHFPTGTTLPLGYTNGRIGYIPDSKVLREGGYEGTETVFFTEGMPAPWRDDIDETLLGAFDELAKELG